MRSQAQMDGEHLAKTVGWGGVTAAGSLAAGLVIITAIFGFAWLVKFFWQGMAITIPIVLIMWLWMSTNHRNREKILSKEVVEKINWAVSTHWVPKYCPRAIIPKPVAQAIKQWNEHMAEKAPWRGNNPAFDEQAFPYHDQLSFDEMLYFQKHIKDEHLNKFCTWFDLQEDAKKEKILKEMQVNMDKIKVEIFDGKHKR